ncbi:MAG TPA: tetratricopeptide repeat protein [Longimicrobiales bacterium]|nr:tetratricopeptide repeat protein [Longimicrobiales bacterium]
MSGPVREPIAGAPVARTGTARVPFGLTRAVRALLPCVLLLTLSGFGDAERGNRLFREGRYEEALAAYTEALEGGRDDAELRYNIGTTLLHLGRYVEAERHFARALRSVDPALRTPTFYNLGLRFLEDGRGSPDPRAQTRLFDAAAESFRQALRLNPADVDAKWNLELTLRDRDEAAAGGGGESEDQQDGNEGEQGGGGGGNGGGAAPPGGSQRPERPPAPGEMTREQAERVLGSVEQDERELFREQLRDAQRERPVLRDW